jgi:hypothetical protein
VIPILLITTLVAGAAGLIAFATQHQKRVVRERSEALSVAASRLGWSFREEVAFDAIPDLKRFELFRQGHSRKLRNLMTSPAGDVRGVVFDFSYTVSSGKSSQTHTQTVFYATSDLLRLPSFSLRPEHFFHRIAGALGFRDINFDHRPIFSRAFLLRGENEAAVRRAFTDRVLEYFETRAGCCAAGLDHELLFWRPGKQVDPGELDAFVREGQEAAQRFVAGARDGAATELPAPPVM